MHQNFSSIDNCLKSIDAFDTRNILMLENYWYLKRSMIEKYQYLKSVNS